MNQFCSKLTVMLVAISAAGLAQAPEKATVPVPPSQPVSSPPVCGRWATDRTRAGSVKQYRGANRSATVRDRS